MRTLHISIFMILIVPLAAAALFLPQYANAQSATVYTDKTLYRYGDNYTISGMVNPVVPNQAVSIVILSPDYPHPASLSVVPSSDGRYSHTLSMAFKATGGNFTVIAQYAGAKNQTTFRYMGLPCNLLNAQTFAHRMPSSNPRMLDSLGHAITGAVRVGRQIQITYPVSNGQNCAQPFAYLVQIQDRNGITVSLSWITGTLLAGQTLNPAQSWMPRHPGTYTAQIFVWQSTDNPNALAPPSSLEFDVEPNSNLTQLYQVVAGVPPNCNEGFVHVIKTQDGSSACVTSNTAQKLIKSGWAETTSQYSQLKLWSSVGGSAYPSGGAMGEILPWPLASPQIFNMTSIVHNGPQEAITLHAYSFCGVLEHPGRIGYGFNSTAPVNFTLYLTNDTNMNPNMVHCIATGKKVAYEENATGYSNELDIADKGLFIFVFDETKPVLAHVKFTYSKIPNYKEN